MPGLTSVRVNVSQTHKQRPSESLISEFKSFTITVCSSEMTENSENRNSYNTRSERLGLIGSPVETSS